MEVLRVCGTLGPDPQGDAEQMAEALGGLRRILDHPRARVHASARGRTRVDPAGPAVYWTSSPFAPPSSGSWETIARELDAPGVVVPGDAPPFLHGSLSGAIPVYVEATDTMVRFCSSLDVLVSTREDRLTADWDSWAEVLAIGAPLEGRTPFVGIHRLGPWATLAPGGEASAPFGHDWPWLEPAVGPPAQTGELLGALRDAIRRRIGNEHVDALLSGGWDSRILTSLATSVAGSEHVTAWTTSSDIGTTLDELVASEVADHLGVRHLIIGGRPATFPDDASAYAQRVDFQTSFHVWLMPLADALHGKATTLLDGLGGGIFLDLPFNTGAGAGRDGAFHRLARYLQAADDVLRPEVVEQLTQRSRESFARVTHAVDGHPDDVAIPTYLTRTLPGISLGPMQLLAGVAPVAIPFLDHEVVRTALRIPRDLRRDGHLYRRLLKEHDPPLAALATAAERTGRRRTHPRRIASPIAAGFYRDLLTNGPVADLLDPALRHAEIPVWQHQLDRTRPQHLIRSLATLQLWLRRYERMLPDTRSLSLSMSPG